MNIKTLHKIILEVWFVGRQAMEKTCISLCVKIRVCDFIYSCVRKEKAKTPGCVGLWDSSTGR